MRILLEEILPFDDEYDFMSLVKFGCVLVPGYSFSNPIVTAYYSDEKKETYLWFRNCPLLENTKKVKFKTDNIMEAEFDVNYLITRIMVKLQSMMYSNFIDLVDFNNRLENFMVELEERDNEREKVAQAG
jgi:hypothetical protein